MLITWDSNNDAIFFSQVYSLYFFLKFALYGGLGFWVLDWVIGVGVVS